MPDPNARRDKALESIASELKSINTILTKIERNTRCVTFTNTPYLEPNDTSVPFHNLPNADENTGPYGVGPHPYE